MKRSLLIALSLAALWPALAAAAGAGPTTLHLGKPGAKFHAVTRNQAASAPAGAEAKGYWVWAGPSHHPYGKSR